MGSKDKTIVPTVLPATPDKDKINPGHYKTKINGEPVQAVDVIEAFFADNAHLSQAFKYMARAGKKEGSSYLEDITKAKWWLKRAAKHWNDSNEPDK